MAINKLKDIYYLRTSFIWLCIAVMFAMLLKFFTQLELHNYFEYSHLLHTHSHIALLAWLFNIFYYLLLDSLNLLKNKKYANIFILLNIALIGMLFSFPFQGYAAISIAFSTIHIILSYIFIFYLIKDTKYSNRAERFAVIWNSIFLILSSIGPYMLGILSAKGLKGSDYYNMSIYFYLHFLYNGWFLGNLFFIIYKRAEEILDEINLKKWFTFFILITLYIFSNFTFSTLWLYENNIINIVSFSSNIFLISALYLIREELRAIITLSHSFNKFLFNTVLTFLIFRAFSSSVFSLPWINSDLYLNRNLVISFLHFTFLGIFNLFIFESLLNKLNKENINVSRHKKYIIAYIISLIFFLFSFISPFLNFNLFDYNILTLSSSILLASTLFLTSIKFFYK